MCWKKWIIIAETRRFSLLFLPFGIKFSFFVQDEIFTFNKIQGIFHGDKTKS